MSKKAFGLIKKTKTTPVLAEALYGRPDLWFLFLSVFVFKGVFVFIVELAFLFVMHMFCFLWASSRDSVFFL